MTETGALEGMLHSYLKSRPLEKVDSGAAAFFASLDSVAGTSPAVAAAIIAELRDQRASVKLIASENYSSLAVQLAQANLLTDKYAEGIAGHRFYAGCDNVDTIESAAASLACELFGADHAYVQPHSGADANLVAFLGILNHTVQGPALLKLGKKNPSDVKAHDWEAVRQELVGQRLLGMDYYSGGHLTHGYRLNVSSQLFEAHSYTVDPDTGRLDYDAIRRQVRELRPRILLAGYSAYPRSLDFSLFREMADEVGATLMVDMAHFAGLVAGKVFIGSSNPVPFAHVVTSTTHKTLRGPRGGLVLANSEFAESIDKGCPLVLGGPLAHVMAAKAVAFQEALRPAFATYARSVVDNAQGLAEEFLRRGAAVATGGTDNHLLLLDVSASYGLTGRQAESALRLCGLTLNRNSLPFDANGPWYTSGLRLGTAAVTTLGMGRTEMTELAGIVVYVLENCRPLPISGSASHAGQSKAKFDLPGKVVDEATRRVEDLLSEFRLYPEIDLEILDPTPFLR